MGTSADDELLTDDEKYEPETVELDESVIRPDLSPVPDNEPEDPREQLSREVEAEEGGGGGGGGGKGGGRIKWKRKQSESR